MIDWLIVVVEYIMFVELVACFFFLSHNSHYASFYYVSPISSVKK